ncbi:lysophospholipid acyltransferase family protein [Roseibacterium sp. SDUM158017]|uniref:lysophospholipid acyltransferase family protein n=1 Tax=Roseicyclus salinarum TaxID=3036773 RepID=UPI0024155EFC|nr:lysophospholipid acyltransferase family protein [Roseibacterium sp. SDUM158017]MDG4648360.1 lysophospholipid acyltransferase family protein [Roseibacterium sp. SDUM158017]
MSMTWDGAPPPDPPRLSLRDRLRAARRAAPLLLLLATGFPLLLLLRPAERMVWGAERPVTPWITQGVCRAACRLFGLTLRVEGRPMRGMGAYVANHVSWLDIFVLNASKRLYFVAKDEVAGWGGIGWLARGTGTVFIRRDRADAARQARLLAERLEAGHRLLFFPEGTSTDGLRVLPFRTTLFAAFFAPGLRETLQIQPVSIVYAAPDGEPASFYGWWGGAGFGSSLLAVLAVRRQGSVRVVYHAPLRVADFGDRKALAAAAEAAVRAGFESGVERRP